MEHIKLFCELYLDSNHAPLYPRFITVMSVCFSNLTLYLTHVWSLSKILDTNKLLRGNYNNPVFGNNIKIISLTRNKKFDIIDREYEVSISIDRDKLMRDYRIYPYDFFINIGSEKYSKSSLNRTKEFEFEEILIKDILNLDKYILNIDFRDISFIYDVLDRLKEYIDKYNINILLKGKKINIDGL
jgi:hypothetical protein